MRKAFIFSLALTLTASFYTVARAEEFAAPGVSNNKLIKFTDHGIVPDSLTMKRDDGLVFFLNSTAKSNLKLELDYSGHHTHCATSNLDLGDDGVARSKRPIPPQDFALVCFPDAGNYELKVYGLPGKSKNSVVKILVE